MRLRRSAGALLAAVLGIVFGVREFARARLYAGTNTDVRSVPPELAAETLRAADGAPVHVFQLAAAPGARTVVHFHNNRETVADAVDLARALHAHGLGVVLVEYRGYGLSRASGAPSEDGVYLDAESALDMLQRQGVGPERIVLSGVSLGTGVAAEMARRGRGGRLVLISPYTSIRALVTDVAPFVPASLLVPDRFDTLEKARAIEIPTLVIHGDADEIVPFWMGEDLVHRLPGARLVRVAGGHHGDLFLLDGVRLLRELVRFAG